MNKKLNKYIAAFDYFNKVLIIFSATRRGVCIISFASVIGATAGIASASFTLMFVFDNRNNKITATNNKK